ncbi:hypothetical protein GCM10027064_20700 [Microbacterium petrolearium]
MTSSEHEDAPRATGAESAHEDRAAPETALPETALPEMGEEAIARVEDAVFEAIAAERRLEARRARRRRRSWSGVAIAASLVVVAAVVSPAILNQVRSTSMGESDASWVAEPGVADGPWPTLPGVEAPGAGVSAESSGGAASEDAGSEEAASGDAAAGASASAGSGSDGALEEDREVAVTAEVSVEVASPADAAEALSALAAEHGGYVQHLAVSAAPEASSDDASTSTIAPSSSDAATLRVPSDSLDAAIADLGGLGEVLRTSIAREDVTGQAVDLRARVAAAEASIARLTELMAEAGSVADLLEVENQLSQRQSELEAYESELEHVEGRVAMSTLQVWLVRQDTPAPVEPGSPFLDGMLTGWNALVAALGGLVAVVGFALPWLVPIAAVVLLVWLIRRRGRARAAARDAEA